MDLKLVFFFVGNSACDCTYDAYLAWVAVLLRESYREGLLTYNVLNKKPTVITFVTYIFILYEKYFLTYLK